MPAQLLLGGSIYIAAVVSVIVVDSHSYGCRQPVCQPVAEVHLCAIDILLSLDLRVNVKHVRSHRSCGHCCRALENLAHDHGVEHRDAVSIFHETAAAHDAEHGRESPAVVLVGSKQGWHDGCRCLALVFLMQVIARIAQLRHGQIVGYGGLYVAVLPRLLEIQRQLPSFVSPHHSGGV